MVGCIVNAGQQGRDNSNKLWSCALGHANLSMLFPPTRATLRRHWELNCWLGIEGGMGRTVDKRAQTDPGACSSRRCETEKGAAVHAGRKSSSSYICSVPLAQEVNSNPCLG
jgi:hypothetical protein